MGTDATMTGPVRDADAPTDFIRTIITEDVKAGKHGGSVVRFPPEPVGHAKSICLNRGRSEPALRRHQSHQGRLEYVESIPVAFEWSGAALDRNALRTRSP